MEVLTFTSVTLLRARFFEQETNTHLGVNVCNSFFGGRGFCLLHCAVRVAEQFND